MLKIKNRIKKLLSVFFLISTLPLVIVSCSKSDNMPADTSANNGNSLKVGLFFLNYSLDPKDYFNGWILVRVGAGETLLRLDDTGRLIPALAEQFKVINKTTYELTLKQGIKFSDASELNADMVKRNLERIFAQSPRAAQYFEPLKISADNTKRTITIYTKKPCPELFYNLCEPLFAVIKLPESNQDLTVSLPVTTGPYQISSFTPNEHIQVTPNPYFRDGKAPLSSIDFYYIPDAQSRLISLKAGDLDIITTVDYPDFKLLQNDSAFNTQSSSGPRTDVVYLNHNNEFLKQKIIRKAISLAINRNEIAQLTGSEAASGVISPHFDFGREITPTDYNPSLAASLLDTAKIIDLNHDGIREFNGQNIELNYRLKSDHGPADSLIIAQCIKEDLAAQGIKVNLIQTENLSAAISASDFDLCSANDSALPTGDSGYFLKSRYHSKGDANFGHYANQDLDALLSKLEESFERNKRIELTSQIAALLNEDVAALYISYPKLNIVSSNKVKDLHLYTFDYYLIDSKVNVDAGTFTN